jgi:two-component system response regulator FixJ
MSDEGTVWIIDDDDAVRDSLAFLLTAEGLTVETFASATAFLARHPSGGGGCILTDVRMPGMSGTDLLEQVACMEGPALPVIVITGHGDIPLAVEVMKKGAVDFIEKPCGDDRIVSAVRAALDRRRVGSGDDDQRAAIRARLATLSARERQVLDGLIAGRPNKTIAFDLGISPRTVEVYRANVMTKMQASNLSELVRLALIAGPPGG